MCLRRSGSGNRFVRDKSLQVKTGIDKLRRVWRAPALEAGLAKHIGCRIADGLHRDKVLANKTPYRKPSRAAAGTLHMTKVRVIDRQHPGGLQFHIILVGPEPRCLATRRVIAGDGGGRPLGLFPRIVNRFNAHAMAIVGIKRAVTNGIDVGPACPHGAVGDDAVLDRQASLCGEPGIRRDTDADHQHVGIDMATICQRGTDKAVIMMPDGRHR